MVEKFIIVDKVDKGYTKIPNAAMRDPNLTDAAYRVLSFLLSITAGFNPTIRKISTTLHISEKKVQRAVTQLKDTGYLSLIRVKDGSLYGGVQWKVSNFPGTFTEEPMDKNDHIYVDKNDQTCADKIDHVENDQTCVDKNDQTCLDKSDDVDFDHVDFDHISEQPIGQQTTVNKQYVNNQMSEKPLHQQPMVGMDDVSPIQYSGNSSWDSSSEAKASPLQGKKSEQGEKVISPKEYMFQQYLKKYPKKPTGSEMEATKQAFLDAVSTDEDFTEIMAGLDAWCGSVDWTKEGGRYITKPLYFLTTRKWEEIPRTINTDIKEDLLRFMRGNTEDCI